MGAVNHTPGPWKLSHRTVVEKPVRIQEHYAIAPEGGPTFAFLPSGRGSRAEIQEANAKLAVAAPELADQLEEALAVMRAIYNGQRSTVGLLDCIDSSRVALHAAGRMAA